MKTEKIIMHTAFSIIYVILLVIVINLIINCYNKLYRSDSFSMINKNNKNNKNKKKVSFMV